MKTKNITVLIFSLLFFTTSCRNLMDDDTYKEEVKKIESEVKPESLIAKEVAIYSADKKQIGYTNLYFPPEGSPGSDIPYMEVKSFIDTFFEDYFTISQNGSLYKMIYNYKDLESEYFTIDFSSGIVFYSDVNKITKSSDIVAETSAISHNTLVNQKNADPSYSINLKDYNIPMKFENGYGFLNPSLIQTLFLRQKNTVFIYNGKDIFMDNETAYLDEEYSNLIVNPKESWSQEFADFSYNFLCLFLDLYYGRKEYLGVTKFDDWFKASGKKEELCSTNIETSETALAKVIYQDIGDTHTYYFHASPYSGLGYDSYHGVTVLINDMSCPVVQTPSYSTRLNLYLNEFANFFYNSKKSAVFLEDWFNFISIYIPRKVEDGSSKYKTIFLNLEGFNAEYTIKEYKELFTSKVKLGELSQTHYDTFFFKSEWDSASQTGKNLEPIDVSDCNSLDKFIDFVKENPDTGYAVSIGGSLGSSTDAISLSLIANYIIKKLNETGERPIENVVLDLSINGGGKLDEETFLSSWFLGKADINITDTINGSKFSNSYIADIDFDGIYNTPWNSNIDPNDNICHLNRYAILSRYSFSASNHFAAEMVASDSVKLFGQKSGGGDCAIIPICMPSGTYFATSSNLKLCKLINGSFVDIEEGIDVDVHIPTQEFDKVYDREAFCKNFL